MNRPLYNKHLPLVIFWSPKSGCTTITKWFFYQIGLLDTALRYDPWIHRYRGVYYGKNPHYLKELKESLSSGVKKSYKLVRNPYTRAVSSYLHACQHRVEWREMNQYINGEEISQQGISFKEFLYYVKYKGPSKHVIDAHISRQFMEGEKKWVRDYIYLENLSQELRKLERIHQLKQSPIMRLAQSHHHRKRKPVSKMNDHLATQKNTPHSLPEIIPAYRSFYDQEAIALVQKIYRIDFEIYRYPLKPMID
ncbi:sulfotransferase family protein [Mechercharimyces sp. CAU 1602]|nr:sulfotransferase family protein [Mechercharimyces sp. CAU 1602]